MRIRIWDRLKAMWGMLVAWSIWHPDAISLDEYKYRDLKRIWLPLYDLVAIGAGIWVTMFKPDILSRLLPPVTMGVLGNLTVVLATVCLLGVAFPKLWKWEIAGKIGLIALIGGAALSVAIYRIGDDPANVIITFLLALALILPMFRLRLLGEEIKERREDEPK